MENDLREEARRRRAPLREAASGLEFAIAAPVGTGQVWRDRVAENLQKTRTALEEHIELTEGENGLYNDLQRDAPRLSNLINLLRKEHDTLASDIEAAETTLHSLPNELDDDCCEGVREATLALLGRISRHRQKGADLIWRAYSVDLGGVE